MTVDQMLIQRRLIDHLQAAILTAQRVVRMARLQAVECSVCLHAVERAITDVQKMQPPPEQKDVGAA